MAKTQDENRATARGVSHAYRLLIGREPDPGGCANHVRLVSGARHSAAELAPYLLQSYEFRSRRGARTGTVAVSPDGYTLFVNPGDRDIGASILAQRTYEPHVEAMVREVLQTGDTFIDVGASIGYFTAPAAHPIGTQGHVAHLGVAHLAGRQSDRGARRHERSRRIPTDESFPRRLPGHGDRIAR